jgi:hypothetical protein
MQYPCGHVYSQLLWIRVSLVIVVFLLVQRIHHGSISSLYVYWLGDESWTIHLLMCQVSFVLGGFAHGQLYLVHCIVYLLVHLEKRRVRVSLGMEVRPGAWFSNSLQGKGICPTAWYLPLWRPMQYLFQLNWLVVTAMCMDHGDGWT